MKEIVSFACSLAETYEPEPAPVLYRVEPIILGPDGWMAFENPSPLVLERRFEEAGARQSLERAISKGDEDGLQS